MKIAERMANKLRNRMKSLYVESSFVLAWLLGEEQAEAHRSMLDDAEAVATSVLTLMEVERGLIRAVAQGRIKPAARMKLLGLFQAAVSGWVLVEISKAVRAQVGQMFPHEPVRTLDAIHLSTASLLLAAFPDLRIVTLDDRVLQNAHALGFETA